MQTARIKLGVIGGIVGGMAMGMWMMLYYLVAGLGFWSPLGYIGHFFLRQSDINSVGQVVLGAIVHMMMSMVLGGAIAAVFSPTSRITGMTRGIVIGLVIWVVMQYGVLNAFDPVAYQGFIQWAFAVGHAFFGAMVGLIAGASRQPAGRVAPAA